jgi:hypothetical protein
MCGGMLHNMRWCPFYTGVLERFAHAATVFMYTSKCVPLRYLSPTVVVLQSHFGALVFSRFLDRDGDGFITLDDISTVQALMMQKSHHFVKVGAVVSTTFSAEMLLCYVVGGFVLSLRAGTTVRQLMVGQRLWDGRCCCAVTVSVPLNGASVTGSVVWQLCRILLTFNCLCGVKCAAAIYTCVRGRCSVVSVVVPPFYCVLAP